MRICNTTPLPPFLKKGSLCLPLSIGIIGVSHHTQLSCTFLLLICYTFYCCGNRVSCGPNWLSNCCVAKAGPKILILWHPPQSARILGIATMSSQLRLFSQLPLSLLPGAGSQRHQGPEVHVLKGCQYRASFLCFHWRGSQLTPGS